MKKRNMIGYHERNSGLGERNGNMNLKSDCNSREVCDDDIPPDFL